MTMKEDQSEDKSGLSQDKFESTAKRSDLVLLNSYARLAVFGWGLRAGGEAENRFVWFEAWRVP